MAIDKAAQALVRLQPREFVHEVKDFVHETLTKGVRAPRTNSPWVRGLKATDSFLHGTAALVAVVPLVNFVSDGPLGAYGVLKFAFGKGFEKLHGKGGVASDVKASGRLSMSAAGISAAGKIAKLVPGPGTMVSTGVSVMAHGAASALSARHATQSTPVTPKD